MLKGLRYRLAVFFAVLGPGFITAMVDNDAGGIITYSQAGARWGYLPLWTLLPITVVLIMTQEMCSRMGAVTGKGLSDLIREEFGLRVTFFPSTPLFGSGAAPFMPCPVGDFAELVAGCVIAGGLF